jgi:hypothetical protein
MAGGLVVALIASVCLLLPVASRAQLQVEFYNTSCPNAEALVRQAALGSSTSISMTALSGYILRKVGPIHISLY